jgi:peptidoglycan/LPS O-acetylase OafA/YrhL
MTAVSQSSIGRLAELDSLRGLMAIWVYISHVLFIVGAGNFGPIGIIKNGSIAVYVFIILSGYAISSSIMNSRASYSQYLLRRLARLYPIYLVGLLLGIMSSAAYPPLLTSLGWADKAEVARLVSRVRDEHSHFLAHLLAHLALIHGAIPNQMLNQSALSFNGPAWSLSLEMQFYVVAPVLVACLLSGRAPGLIIIAAVALTGNFLGHFFPYVGSFLPQSVGWFVLGILTAIHLPKLVDRPTTLFQISLAIFSVAMISHDLSILLPIIIWLGVMIGCTYKNYFTSAFRLFMSWPPLVKFGEASYSFYILHMPILIIWGSLLIQHIHLNNKWSYAAALSASFPITGTAAILSYELFEKRINTWAKRTFAGPVERSVSVVEGLQSLPLA